MTALKTTGIVIDRLDFSETSQVVCFYTRDFGKIRVIAKGAKRPKSSFEGAIDLLTGGTMLYLDKGAERLGILTAFHQTETFRGVRRDLGRLHQALWVCELLSRLTRENDANEEVFRLAWDTLARIAAEGGGRPALPAFECRLLGLLGFAPRADRCTHCERMAGAGDVHGLGFSVRYGGMLCAACARLDPDRLEVSPGALALIDNLVWGKTTSLERLKVDDVIRTQARRAMAATVTHLIGREPRMLRFLE